MKGGSRVQAAAGAPAVAEVTAAATVAAARAAAATTLAAAAARTAADAARTESRRSEVPQRSRRWRACSVNGCFEPCLDLVSQRGGLVGQRAGRRRGAAAGLARQRRARGHRDGDRIRAAGDGGLQSISESDPAILDEFRRYGLER